jgi:hypothetical protein
MMQIWTFEKLGPIHIIQKFITMFWLKHLNFETVFLNLNIFYFIFFHIYPISSPYIIFWIKIILKLDFNLMKVQNDGTTHIYISQKFINT